MKISKDEFSSVENVLDLFGEKTQFQIFPSKGEARKMIQGGGVSINKEKISNPNDSINFQLLQDKYLLIQKGKKNYFILEVR